VKLTGHHLTTQDDKIFQTARSINCAQFKNIVMEDFLKGLMGLRNVGPSPNIDLMVSQAVPPGLIGLSDIVSTG